MLPRPSSPSRVLLYVIDGNRFALAVEAVEHVVRAVAVTPLPGAPDIILGLIDVHGSIVPVINMRRRLGLPEREIELTDHFILALSGGRRVALVADTAGPVIDLPLLGCIETGLDFPSAGLIDGLVQMDDGMALINDLEKFLSLNDRQRLDEALANFESLSFTQAEEPAH